MRSIMCRRDYPTERKWHLGQADAPLVGAYELSLRSYESLEMRRWLYPFRWFKKRLKKRWSWQGRVSPEAFQKEIESNCCRLSKNWPEYLRTYSCRRFSRNSALNRSPLMYSGVENQVILCSYENIFYQCDVYQVVGELRKLESPWQGDRVGSRSLGSASGRMDWISCNLGGLSNRFPAPVTDQTDKTHLCRN